MKPWKIYGLVDPRSGEIRYVGKTELDVNRRLQGHLNEAKNDKAGLNRYKNRWIRSLWEENLSPQIVILEEGTGNWEIAEKDWIAKFRRQVGDRLTNAAEGGICPPPNLHTRESFDKSRNSRKGKKIAKPFTKEHLENLSKAHKGYRHSEEWKRRHAEIMTGKILGPNSPEAIRNQRLSRIMRKYQVSAEVAVTFPEYFTTPEMIELAIARNSGSQAAAAKELNVPINLIRYYDPRKKLNMR